MLCLERRGCATGHAAEMRVSRPVQAQKARVEDMVAEEATIDGLEHIECKIFK